MSKTLIENRIAGDRFPNIVLFGGNPYRRDEVVRLLSQIPEINIYGTLGEEEGFAQIEQLDRKVKVVLIGGRYSMEQRHRIQRWVSKNMPNAHITQPGYDYPYDNQAITHAVKTLFDS